MSKAARERGGGSHQPEIVSVSWTLPSKTLVCHTIAWVVSLNYCFFASEI